MTSMSKGSNLPVPTAALHAVVSWRTDAPTPDVDVSALLLDSSGKVRSDADFVFYNQPQHASGAVRHEGKRPQAGETTDAVLLELAQVEPAVDRIVLGASADGGSFGQVPGLRLRVLAQDGNSVAEFDIEGASSETAFVFGEFYRRGGEWKFRAVGQGYDSGLAGLASDFGISVEGDDDAPAAAPVAAPAVAPAPAPTAAPAAVQQPPAPPVASGPPAGFGPPPPGYGVSTPPPNPGTYPPPQPAAPYPPVQTPYPPQAPAAAPYQQPYPQNPPYGQPAPAAAPAPGGPMSLKKQKLVSLEKQLSDRGDHGLLDLTKRAAVTLEKRGLSEHTARVALCLDISASMHSLYSSGKVQGLVERVLALGLRFDDNAQVDVFLFGANGHEAGSVGMDSYRGWTQQMLQQRRLEGGTDYAAAMQLIRQRYFGSAAQRNAPYADRQPVYVMFVTDGHTTSEAATKFHVQSSSYEPLFWQFMGIGRSSKSVDAPQVAAQPAPPAKQGRFARKLAAMSANWGDGTFRFLEELDDLPGRYVDNADFFCVQDPANISDEQLYDLMTAEYPSWLQAAHAQGLLRP